MGKAYTEEREPGDVAVRLSFPIRTGMGADKRPFANLRITDEVSGQVIVEVELNAEEFTGMVGGVAAHVSGAYITTHPERIGKRSQNHSTDLCYADVTGGDDAVDAEALAVRTRYLTDGWQSVRVDRTNYGRRVVAYRWIDA